MRCTIGITFHRYGGHGDDRTFGQPFFEIIIFRFAFGEALPPAVVVDDDFNVVRIAYRLRIIDCSRPRLPLQKRFVISAIVARHAVALRRRVVKNLTDLSTPLP